jgi:hypothetical protein
MGIDDRTMRSQIEAGSHERVDALRTELAGTLGRLKEEAPQLGDPQARALVETSAEVVQGLVTAFEHYERRNEPAWRPG